MPFSWKLPGTLAALVCAALVASAPASAVPPYDPDTHETDVTLPAPPSPQCTHNTWDSPPKVVIHTGEFVGGPTREANMIAAIEAVNTEFNKVGATAAQITDTELSTEPFTQTTLFDVSDPVIHVGFVSSLTNPAAIASAKPYIFSGTCELARVNIAVLDLGVYDWRFNAPADAGENYWEAAAEDGEQNRYFRTSYLHELLHGFGLEHSATTFAFMNYGARPWANRDDDERVRPLPADVRLLRDLYPAAGERTELATLTTWFDADDISDTGAALGKVLCAPSLGSGFSASLFDEHCGSGGAQGGSTAVCAGNMLRTRFALANYSTHDVDFGVRLWFSIDDKWDWHDTISPTQPDEVHVDAAESSRRGISFAVPALPGASGTEYHTIVRAAGEVSDSIPLPGTVTAC
jgi:hypothetical protein